MTSLPTANFSFSEEELNNTNALIKTVVPSTEKVHFCNIIDDNFDRSDLPKNSKDMASFIESIYEDVIMKKNLTETDEFENDEVRVCLRRRKLGLKKQKYKEDCENLEMFLFGVDESQTKKKCKIIGDATIKESNGYLIIKSCKAVQIIMKKCQECRLILWVCSKDKKELLQILVCTKVYPVGDKQEDSELSSRKKTKISQSGEPSSSGVVSSNTENVLESQLSPEQIIQQPTNTQPQPRYKSTLTELSNLSKEELIERVLRLEGVIEDRDKQINENDNYTTNLYIQCLQINEENLSLKNTYAPQQETQHKQVFIDQLEDAKENFTNVQQNSAQLVEFEDNLSFLHD